MCWNLILLMIWLHERSWNWVIFFDVSFLNFFSKWMLRMHGLEKKNCVSMHFFFFCSYTVYFLFSFFTNHLRGFSNGLILLLCGFTKAISRKISSGWHTKAMIAQWLITGKIGRYPKTSNSMSKPNDPLNILPSLDLKIVMLIPISNCAPIKDEISLGSDRQIKASLTRGLF